MELMKINRHGRICRGLGSNHSREQWLSKPWSSSASCFGMTSLGMPTCRSESCRKERFQVLSVFGFWLSHGLLGQSTSNLRLSGRAPQRGLISGSNNFTDCNYKSFSSVLWRWLAQIACWMREESEISIFFPKSNDKFSPYGFIFKLRQF